MSVETDPEKARSDWRQAREALNNRIETLRQQGVCYSCHDQRTGQIFGQQSVVYEDDRFKVVLDLYPQARGHTIVVYKPHLEDISQLMEGETADLFQLCVRVVNEIKQALGAEKVYLYTMCDGGINHLHVQLLPRYSDDPIGSKRFVAPRTPLTDGEVTARRIASRLRMVEE